VEKTYIARVMGVFPEEMVTVKAGLSWDAKWNMVYAVEEGVERDEGGREAKVSHTDFQRLSVSPDGKTSLVKCWYPPTPPPPHPPPHVCKERSGVAAF
jgi:23S rRNA-/tRNA-specific pseudouridylate synthase